MNRRGFIRNIVTGSAGLYLGTTPFDLFAGQDIRKITILHTNDLHSNIEAQAGANNRYNGMGGIARISEYAKNVRKENPNTLLLDAGDMFQGTPYFNLYKGELIFKAMTMAGYDAGTIGNHDFDNGLKGLKDQLKHAGFPLVSSNYDFTNTILNGYFPRFKIFKKSGIKIGIYAVGYKLKGMVSDKNYGDTIYNDPLQTAMELETFLVNEKKCDLVICLSHLGLKSDDGFDDMTLAAETSYTDLILGGHTHSSLKEPLELLNKIGEKVLVNQVWRNGLMIGRIDFVFQPLKKKKQLVLAK